MTNRMACETLGHSATTSQENCSLSYKKMAVIMLVLQHSLHAFKWWSINVRCKELQGMYRDEIVVVSTVLYVRKTQY